MTSETNDIWPAVDLTDSEDEDEAAQGSSSRVDPLKCDTLTEEEINGDFPPLLIPGYGDGSGSSDEEETVAEKKTNPYMTVDGDEVKKKFEGKLRELHLKRVSFLTYLLF